MKKILIVILIFSIINFILLFSLIGNVGLQRRRMDYHFQEAKNAGYYSHIYVLDSGPIVILTIGKGEIAYVVEFLWHGEEKGLEKVLIEKQVSGEERVFFYFEENNMFEARNTDEVIAYVRVFLSDGEAEGFSKLEDLYLKFQNDGNYVV